MKEKRIGMAVVGCGRIGRTHIESIKELGDIAHLVAVIDINSDIARGSACKYNTKFYVNTDGAFNDPGIQAVVICLPNNLHTPVSLEAMEKGKHALVEKPFALSVKDAERIIETALAKNLVLMIGQSFRFFKAV